MQNDNNQLKTLTHLITKISEGKQRKE